VGVWALVDELWGARPPNGAHRTVRTYVSRLRAALRHTGGADAAAVLVTRPPGYQLRMDPSAVDAVRFERLVASGGRMLATQPWQAFELLSTALGLWRGDAFAEFRHLRRHPGPSTVYLLGGDVRPSSRRRKPVSVSEGPHIESAVSPTSRYAPRTSGDLQLLPLGQSG